MPAFIKFDGVDGEIDAAHSDANWELTVKVLDSGTFYGGTTDVDLAIRVVDTETGNGGPVTENESGLIYSGESGGMIGVDDRPMSWDILKQAPWDCTAEAGGHATWIEVESMTWGDAGSGHASPTGGTGHYTQMIWADTSAAHGAGGGGGAGKVSVHDVSLSTSVPKAAAGDTVEQVEAQLSVRQIEIEYGVEDPVAAGTDTSAIGNTYLGVTTIEQGVLQVEHGTMMLSFQYYMA